MPNEPHQEVQLVENTNITRYYQRSTTNTSFVEMSNYLKAIGIKNNRFMLTLLDPDLANIDPHDPNLPLVYKRKVLCEVYNNFWYYLREVVRVPSTGEPSKFILNRGNMAFLYLATMNFNCILLQPRQTGKTIAAAAFYTYVYNFRTQNTQISLLNKEFKDSKDNLARIRAIRDLLPTYLRMDAVLVLNSANTLVVLESIIVIHELSLDTPPDGSTPMIGGYLGTRLDLRGISSNILNSYLLNIRIVFLGFLQNFLTVSNSSFVNGLFSDSSDHSRRYSLLISGQSHSDSLQR